MNFSNIFSALGAFVPLLTIVAVTLGIFLFIAGLYRFAMVPQNPQYTAGQGFGRLLAGVLLMSITATVTMASVSTTGETPNLDFLAYSPPDPSGTHSEVLRLAIIGVRILGYAVLIRGIWLLGKAWDNRHELGPVFTHLIGGVFCVNILWFLHALGYTVGGTLSSTITNLFG